HGEALPLAGRDGCGSRFSYSVLSSFLFHFSGFALRRIKIDREEIGMAKPIKGSSKPSAKASASGQADASSTKVQMAAAKVPAKAAPKQPEKPPAKPMTAPAKPKLSVQELRDRVEQLEQAYSALKLKNKADRKSLTEARAQIKTLQAELVKSRAAPPVSETVATPENDPSPSSAIAAETVEEPSSKPKANPQKKPVTKRSKI
ncbi:hypothetical protein, partial [Acidiphilium sp.]|uniref:hypothetical protein n=1 Tax=Acidiphilium sp. TaxID=527 RepID=UPI003CFE0190